MPEEVKKPAAAPAKPAPRPAVAAPTEKPYIVVCESELSSLENRVTKLVAQGYVPSGSLVIQTEHNDQYYYQAMIQKTVAAR